MDQFKKSNYLGISKNLLCLQPPFDIYEYERQKPAPCRGLAPPVLTSHTRAFCNIFPKFPKF